jgi:hypothetical protein
MVKRSEKTFISFRFEVKQSKKCLFRFALKRNEKIGSETKNFWKRNKAKIRYINFALVGSEKFEGKRNETFFFHVRMRNACETDLVSLRFALKRKFLFAKNRRTLSATRDSIVRITW